MATHLLYHTTLPDGAGAPEWVHLLPAGRFAGVDGRGPYTLRDPEAVIRQSMSAGKLPIDENHATDLAMRQGGAAPARGWIVEMQSRQDGIWGRVEWTRAGQRLMADHEYRGISPAFMAPDGVVTRIARASLTNTPNLTLNHLHTQEPGMDLAELRRPLGLPETATQDDVTRALATAGAALTLHAQVAGAMGVDTGTSPGELVTGLRQRLVGVSTHAQQITALQGEISGLRRDNSRVAAERMLEKAASEGAVIDQAMRDNLIELHFEKPDMAQSLVNGLPRQKLSGDVTRHAQAAGATGGTPLTDSLASAFGLKAEDIRADMETRNGAYG